MHKKLLRHISALGTGFFLLVLTLFMYLNHQERLSAQLALVFILTAVIGWGIKFFYEKHRPDFDPKKKFDYIWPIKKWMEIDEESFPSLHAARSAGLLVILGSYFNVFYVQLFLAILALAVSASRVFLKRHYIEDVAGGVVLGLIIGFSVLFWM